MNYYRSFILCMMIFPSSTTFAYSFSMQSYMPQNFDASRFIGSYLKTIPTFLSQLSKNLLNSNYVSENKTTVAVVTAGLALSSYCLYLLHQNSTINTEFDRFKKENENKHNETQETIKKLAKTKDQENKNLKTRISDLEKENSLYKKEIEQKKTLIDKTIHTTEGLQKNNEELRNELQIWKQNFSLQYPSTDNNSIDLEQQLKLLKKHILKVENTSQKKNSLDNEKNNE